MKFISLLIQRVDRELFELATGKRLEERKEMDLVSRSHVYPLVPIPVSIVIIHLQRRGIKHSGNYSQVAVPIA